MKEWQKLSENEMDDFINTVCHKLNIQTWNGIDMADIYEKAVAIKQHQNTSSHSEYMAALNVIKEWVESKSILPLEAYINERHNQRS